MQLTISGKALTAFSQDQKRLIYEELSKKLAQSAQEFILRGFNRSVELAAMVGERSDAEAIKAITRGLKVEVLNVDPLRLEAKFQDDYAHWYGGQDLPDDVAETLQKIIDTAIQDWLGSPEAGKVVEEVLLGN
ncbi:MAG: hypothetical protein ACWGQW_03470 [bacterium]